MDLNFPNDDELSKCPSYHDSNDIIQKPSILNFSHKNNPFLGSEKRKTTPESKGFYYCQKTSLINLENK